MYQCSNKLKFYLFADDTNILCTEKNLKAFQVIVNAELRNFCDWLTSYKFSLNTKRSLYYFTLARRELVITLTLAFWITRKIDSLVLSLRIILNILAS